MITTDNTQTLANALAEIKRLEDEVQRQRERHRTTWTQLEQVKGLLDLVAKRLREFGTVDRIILERIAAALSQQAEPAPAQDEREARDWEMKAQGVMNVAHLVVSKSDQGVLRRYANDMLDEARRLAARPAQTEQQPEQSGLSGNCCFEVISGREGPSLYIGDGTIGHRLAGNKPWGGGRTLHTFKVDIAGLVREASSLSATPSPAMAAKEA